MNVLIILPSMTIVISNQNFRFKVKFWDRCNQQITRYHGITPLVPQILQQIICICFHYFKHHLFVNRYYTKLVWDKINTTCVKDMFQLSNSSILSILERIIVSWLTKKELTSTKFTLLHASKHAEVLWDIVFWDIFKTFILIQ